MTEKKATAPHEALQDESDSAPAGVAFGPVLFEKFLLAVIAAYRDVDGTPRQRLDQAMQALMGHKSSLNPLPDDPDDKALLFMAEEYDKDECARTLHHLKARQGRAPQSAAPKARSTLRLAREATERFFPGRDAGAAHAIANRLRQKFSGTYQTGKLGRDPSVDYTRTYRYRAVEHDYVEESLEQQGLERLRDEFAKWGVRLKL